MDIDDIIDILAISLIGVVPEDEIIVVSTNRGEPAVLDYTSRAGEAYRRIARRLEGEEVPLMALDYNGGLFDKVRRMFKLAAR